MLNSGSLLLMVGLWRGCAEVRSRWHTNMDLDIQHSGLTTIGIFMCPLLHNDTFKGKNKTCAESNKWSRREQKNMPNEIRHTHNSFHRLQHLHSNSSASLPRSKNGDAPLSHKVYTLQFSCDSSWCTDSLRIQCGVCLSRRTKLVLWSSLKNIKWSSVNT